MIKALPTTNSAIQGQLKDLEDEIPLGSDEEEELEDLEEQMTEVEETNQSFMQEIEAHTKVEIN